MTTNFNASEAQRFRDMPTDDLVRIYESTRSAAADKELRARGWFGSVAKSVAAEVRAQMARRQLSGKSIAREMGISQQSISLRLTGKVPFDVTELAHVARILGVEIVSLFPDEVGADSTWNLGLAA